MTMAIDFSDQCAHQDFDVLIYCTHRSFEEQASLYRNGRSFSKIVKKRKQLEKIGCFDLADILMDVGPQNGRSIRTNAGPGQSLHNYGLAFDGCPIRDGKPVWGTADKEDRGLWAKYGEIAESVGLEWSGRWKRFREFPHWQQSGQDWRELIKAA